LEEDESVESYRISQIECGCHHSLLLVNCRRKVPASLKIRSMILDTDPVPAGISIKDVEAEQGEDGGGLRLKDGENAHAANKT